MATSAQCFSANKTTLIEWIDSHALIAAVRLIQHRQFSIQLQAIQFRLVLLELVREMPLVISFWPQLRTTFSSVPTSCAITSIRKALITLFAHVQVPNTLVVWQNLQLAILLLTCQVFCFF